MKRKIIIVLSIVILSFIGLFIYHRYKTVKIDHLIGSSQYRVEEYLDYPNDLVTIEKIEVKNVSDRIKKVIEENEIKTSKPVIKYTLSGSVRKQVFWLIDKGDGYYVIEAINTNN